MQIIKRNGLKEEVNPQKIKNAINAAFKAKSYTIEDTTLNDIVSDVKLWDNITIEDIQDEIIEVLKDFDYSDVAECYNNYRLEHKNSRLIRERMDFIDNYSESTENAAQSSETDTNANVTVKNIANLEGEVYKTTNRIIQRQRMKDILNKMFPEVAKQYSRDLENHIIYTHDEASSPVPKPYCMANTLFPLMVDGVGNIDGVTPCAPNDIQSFSGQVTNLAFLLSSQIKGAVALGDYIIALNYYVIKEFGSEWYKKTDIIINNSNQLKTITIKKAIEKGMKQFIYGVNQPAGNRSYNSPFTNLSFYDHTYFKSLFEDFYYPDGTQPQWEAIDVLQRIFLNLHRELRLIKPLTFPVTTIAMVHDNKDIIDKEYKDLCAGEWSKGSSHFAYINNSPTSLASCCRVLNEISENTFSSTTGMTGIMTGSCNVITLNINRIVQNAYRKYKLNSGNLNNYIKNELISILERVYKYHIAYKSKLYELEEKHMFAPSNGGYIYLKKLYSTIGLIGYFEAAKFLKIDPSNNENYFNFLQLIFGTVKDQNKLHSIHDKKHPYLFNSEAVPGESLAVKLYKWDKQDGYEVPEEQNLYNCYFYNPWDNTSVLNKFILHGSKISKFCDGGQAAHINLNEHLSKEQYLKLIDFAIVNGTNYFTFNIPMSECQECKHIVNAPIHKCPICGSDKITYWTRIIGYLRPVTAWGNARNKEFSRREYNQGDKNYNYKQN